MIPALKYRFLPAPEKQKGRGSAWRAYIERLLCKQGKKRLFTIQKRDFARFGHGLVTLSPRRAFNPDAAGGGSLWIAALLNSYGLSLLQNITKGVIWWYRRLLRCLNMVRTSVFALTRCLIATFKFIGWVSPKKKF